MFGCMSIIAGVLALTLPETRWVPLPETIEDIAAWKGQDLSKKAVKQEYQLAKQREEQDEPNGEMTAKA